jgi:hypothetical protein
MRSPNPAATKRRQQNTAPFEAVKYYSKIKPVIA